MIVVEFLSLGKKGSEVLNRFKKSGPPQDNLGSAFDGEQLKSGQKYCNDQAFYIRQHRVRDLYLLIELVKVR